MYYDFFGLRENPFSIVPAPDYFYMSDRHEQALAHLMYSLQGGTGGFVLLTGEVGTGKTMVCRTWLAGLTEQTSLAYIINPSVSEIELLETICDEFAIPYQNDQDDLKTLFDLITQYLHQNHCQQKHSVLLIDEAQLLTPLSLELLKLLTQIERDGQKLLKVVLIGQPELLALLRKESLLVLAQGIHARYHLLPLDYREVCLYVAHRLQIAGCRLKVFNRLALKELQLHSQGVPRLINLICDQSMLAAFAKGQHQVSAKMVRQVANEIQGIRHQSALQQLIQPYRTVVVSGIAAAIIGSLAITLTPPASHPPVKIGANNSWFLPSFNTQKTVNISAQSKRLVKRSRPVNDIDNREGQYLDSIIASSRSPHQAMQNLYKLWGYTLPAERADCNTGQIVGLRCLEESANLEQLKRMNHPVVVKMQDSNQRPYFATLAKLYRGVELLVDDSHIRVSESWFNAHWTGEYTLLWKAPLQFKEYLKRGDQGPAVSWLSASLSQLQAYDGTQTDHFEQTLEQALKQFQQQQQLTPDGIAGVKTLLQLNLKVRPEQPRLVFTN
ncbi:AAA family ATPase [Motilimonas cestriensis]|uniref:AAA family ATPase n=1 Tax=Motilimonas cestriensis TaxID=2742685 RepID=A0ABS8W965_9GAMM|nr:AAA family ATPase [Motilimonas cestriensis]MCE2594288.1 AAA family ATPase [Motilimonas cestriensis]